MSQPIAVVCVAMEDEAAPFLARAESVGEPVASGRATFREIVVAGRPVLLVCSGIGLVNAASALASVLATRPVSAVVSAGSAGGLGADVRVGDVVVGASYVHAGADARAFGYALGQVPGMPATYAGDPALVADAAGAASGLTVRQGLMASSDAFVAADAVPGILAGFPGVLAVDMESVALAQVCFSHGVPFVAVRSISDLCGPAAGSDFATHIDDAADRSAAVVLAVLGERRNQPVTS